MINRHQLFFIMLSPVRTFPSLLKLFIKIIPFLVTGKAIFFSANTTHPISAGYCRLATIIQLADVMIWEFADFATSRCCCFFRMNFMNVGVIRSIKKSSSNYLIFYFFCPNIESSRLVSRDFLTYREHVHSWLRLHLHQLHKLTPDQGPQLT